MRPEQEVATAITAAQAATVASTEIYANLEETATQISGAYVPSTTSPSAPVVPGFTVIETSDSYILVRGDQIIVLKKSQMYGYNPPHTP